MKKFGICLLILLLSAVAYAGKPPSNNCADVPITWVFENTTSSNLTSAFTMDRADAYQDGVDGVSNSVIHFVLGVSGVNCGSKDATLNLIRAKRTLSIALPQPISGSIIGDPNPDFAGGASIATKAGVNIRNIIGYPVFRPGTPATFYTKMNIGFGWPLRHGTDYQLAALPFDGVGCPDPSGLLCVDGPTIDIASSYQNSPVPAAWVKVNYIPASGTTPDQWIVEGEMIGQGDNEIQRMTLLSGGVHKGQYSMPFRIRVTAQAPLPNLP